MRVTLGWDELKTQQPGAGNGLSCPGKQQAGLGTQQDALGAAALLLWLGVESWLGHLSTILRVMGYLIPLSMGCTPRSLPRIRGIVWVPGGSGWSEVFKHQGARQAANLPPSKALALDLLV